MAAVKMEEGKAMKNQVKSKDPTQQTMTINFVPEKQRYSKPTNMEEYIRTYFEGINGINRRIIAEERKIISQNRNTWQNLSIEERDKLLNDKFIASDIRQKYKANDAYWRERTPWQHEELLISSDELQPRHDRTDSISINDSFSKPFQWATKSQRNLKFPAIKQEKKKTEHPQPKQSTSTHKMKEDNKLQNEDDTVKKLNNVEQSLKEKQIKTTNENIKGNIESNKAEKSTMRDDKILTTGNNEVISKENNSTSEQVNGDGNEYMDGSSNIFEFLQSWDP